MHVEICWWPENLLVLWYFEMAKRQYSIVGKIKHKRRFLKNGGVKSSLAYGPTYTHKGLEAQRNEPMIVSFQ